MLKFDREQAIALGALGAVLLGCALAIVVSIGARSSALQELGERQQILSRLQIQAGRQSDARGRLVPGRAPPAAFLDAPTPGLASAQLQTYIARVAAQQQAALMSSAVEPAAGDDAADAIRVQAMLETNLKSLQAMLYRLESGTPYVFVETLAVQPSTAAEFGAEDPTLRLTIGVRALWRRGQT